MRPERIIKGGLLVAVIGMVDGSPFIIAPGFVLFLVGLISWFYGNHLPGAVSGYVELSKRRVFYGEFVSGVLRIVNDQPFPLPWLTTTMEWPEELVMVDDKLLQRREGKMHFKSSHSMHGFERLNRSISMQCLGRGEFTVGPLEVRLADPFGFAEGRRVQVKKEKILIYPRMVPLTFQPARYNNPFGGKAIPSWLYQDPANFRGIRDYQPSDPYSRVSWKATAKAGSLQTKVYDASFATEITVVLNITTSKFVWELNMKSLERSLVVCASMIRQCYELGYRFSFYANCSVGAGQSAAIRIGAGESQLRRCLETMSRVLPYQFNKCEYVLAKAGQNIGDNSQIYLVTAVLTEQIMRTLEDLRVRGSKVAVILTNQNPETTLGNGNILVYRIQEGEEWDELEQITLSPLER